MIFRGPRKSEEALGRVQFKRLRRIVAHAYEHSSFYASHYDAHGFHPRDLKSCEDIQHIPIVRRGQIKGVPGETLVTRPDIHGLHGHTTSGSSGMPMTIYFDKRDMTLWMYLWLRAYMLAGLKLTDTLVILCGPVSIYRKGFWRKLGLLRRDYYNVHEPAEEIRRGISEKYDRLDALRGSPGDLVNLACEVRKHGAFPMPRLVFTCAGAIDDRARDCITEAFGTPPLDFYGAVENGVIAFQTPDSGGRYYVNEDFTLLESEPAPYLSDNEGKAILTSLYRRTTPIIRYEIGDVIDFGDGARDAGARIRFKTINGILGKYSSYVALPDGTVVSPRLIKQNIAQVGNIRKFQLIQDRIDHAVIRIEKADGYTPEAERELQNLMDRTFRNLVTLDIVYSEEIGRGDGQKIKVIESTFAQDLMSSTL